MESTTMCACGCGRTATGNVRGWEGVVIPDGTPYSMACMGGSSGVDAFAMRLNRRRSRPAADQSLGVTCCVLCGGRGGLTTWGNMDSSELGGVKVCDVCVPEMRVEDRGETNVRNANRMRARLGKEPWPCDKCGEKPAVCMPGWGVLCTDCDRAEVRDTPAPQADSGFKVGDRIRLRNTIGTVEGRVTSLNRANTVLYWTGDDGSHRVNELDQLARIGRTAAVVVERFTVGDRVRVRAAEGNGCWDEDPFGTVTNHEVFGAVEVTHDSGVKQEWNVSRLEPLPPSEDPKRQPEANSAGPCGRCGDRDTVERADGILCAPCRERLFDPVCRICGTDTPSHRMANVEQCVYCAHTILNQTGDGDLGRICEFTEGIDRMATPKEAERREVWDWPVDSDAPDGCA